MILVRKSLLVLSMVLISTTGLGTLSASAIDPNAIPSFVSKFGSYGSNAIHDSKSLAIDSQGNKYTSSDSSIIKINSNNTITSKFGGSNCNQPAPDGTLCGEARGLAVDSHDNLLVADFYNHRIQKFDKNGNFITKWGTSGTGDGQFFWPNGIAIDSHDNIYVIDENYRVQKFDSSGTFILSWGGYGNGNTEFQAPSSIAIDSNDNIHIADRSQSKIKKFSPGGIFLAEWGTAGQDDGEFAEPWHITIDSTNTIYVTDNTDRVQRFTINGSFIGKWVEPRLSNISGLTHDSHNNIFVLNDVSSKMEIFQFSSPSGAVTTTDRFELNGLQFNQPVSSTHDAEGNIYVVDILNNRIVKLDSSGNPLLTWGTPGTGDGQFQMPYYVKYNPTTNQILVADTGNDRIQLFDTNGNLASQWSNVGSGDGELSGPISIAVDKTGNVYVGELYNFRIQKFDASGNFITKWGTSGSGDGQFHSTFGLEIDAEGNVYAVDTGNNRIQKFDSDGNFITKWGASGAGDGQFQMPVRIAVDPAGYVYVSDYGNNRIQKFDSDGNFITKWGASGAGDGQFSGPGGIEIDHSGNIYVTELINSRIQKFAYPPTVSSVDNSTLTLSPFVNVTCHETKPESGLASQDSSYDYPAGLVSFCIDVAKGSGQTIDLRFKTDLKPNQVVVRKYNSNTKQYSNVPNVNISEITESGQHYLRLIYKAVDGGQNDEDGVANGKIIDPIGLGITQGTPINSAGISDSVGAPNTGLSRSSLTVLLAAAVACIALIGLTVVVRRKLDQRR